jgi:hypothetical protein
MSLRTQLVPKLVVCLSDGIEGSSRRNGCSNGSIRSVTVDLSLSAVPRDVTGLAATVASLAGSVQRAAVGSGAVAGDMAYHTLVRHLHGLRQSTHRACRTRSTSWPGPGSRGQSGSVHRTCSKWQGERRQRSRP